jgi:hypothetical protein
MMIEIAVAFFSLCLIVFLFQFCKCRKQTVEGFYEISSTGLESKLAQQINRDKLSEMFVTREEIDKLERSTIQILGDIQSIKGKMNKKKTVQEEDFDDTELLNKFKRIDEEIAGDDLDAVDDDEDEYDAINSVEEDDADDVVEGFMERTTHNCDSF